MFTGLIQQIATCQRFEGTPQCAELQLGIKEHADDPVLIGESIAINGVCLTVKSMERTAPKEVCVGFDLSQETLKKTSFGVLLQYKKNTPQYFNIERAIKLGERLGGHFVTGHIDQVATILEIDERNHNIEVAFSLAASTKKFITEKGSVAIDGISLTVCQTTKDRFLTSIIPYTWKETIMHHYHINRTVNLEVDLIARYLVNITQA